MQEERAELPNDYIEAARVYHDVTKHSYTSVRSTPHVLEWDNKPLPYKIYPEVAGLSLPRDLSLSRMPALEAIGPEEVEDPAAALDLPALTRILFSAGGLTRQRRVGGEIYHFRAAPSAGALYPIEIYAAAADVEGLEAGLYHFSPADLKLRGLRPGDWRATLVRAAAMRTSIRRARAVVLMSAIFWRSAWKYRARAYRYCFWDAGTILANLTAAARAEGIPTETVTAFVDAELEQLLGIHGEREAPLCMVALGRTASESRQAAQPAPLKLETVALSQNEVSYDDLLKMHRASRLVSTEEVSAVASARVEPHAPAQSAGAVRPATIRPGEAAGLGETILRRGSTRVFAREPIGADELATILARSSVHPRVDFPPLSDTYMIVNAVEGMEPGAYYYRRESGSFEMLRGGDFRGQAGYLCLEQQPLGADSSVLLVYMANLEAALRALGNRGYRDVHLEAGILGGRAYLAAYALGRGATGLTFYDDDTAEFFKPHAAGESALLMVAIGVPRGSR
ncbi:MAG: SagB/ThcOx family dehydrogenase [Candidatus Binataceae bacterium]